MPVEHWYDHNRERTVSPSSFWFLFIDIDECIGSSPCPSTGGICTNTRGSYSCACAEGFTGNGISCSGKEAFFLKHAVNKLQY